MNQTYTAVIVPAEEGGFWGYVLEVPNANSQGETEEELLENLKDSLALVQQCMREIAEKEVAAQGGSFESISVAS